MEKAKKELALSSKSRLTSQAGIFAIAIIFIVAGILRGELYVVFTRAVNICLECMGLG
ncbi:MAG: CD1871A family CXXC motif-containing protein [Phoenicibacter congonensis]|uniref:CD1871A family CXXC motif-containing protein n=1 Tax=Phoenicibacter congonensis TaxID=1944646 RepID=A0AA43RHK3_9ACTN|nr:CD1871A family CXXC motif-containing protein [Phoenicibacter congonensis]